MSFIGMGTNKKRPGAHFEKMTQENSQEHSYHCVSEKYGKIAVRTVNTDVLVLFLSYVSQVHDSSSNIVIYAYMVNSTQEYYNITAAVDLLGTDTCKELPSLYAFIGCDIVSRFFSK